MTRDEKMLRQLEAAGRRADSQYEYLDVRREPGKLPDAAYLYLIGLEMRAKRYFDTYMAGAFLPYEDV